MNPARVFYSWSSDNDPRVCRNLIRDALSQACRTLTAELEESDRPVELDHDTKGETGSPAITETIERKIRECDVFVADLTPTVVQVRPDGEIRLLPNSNVMYELGYANRSIGSDRIIWVMNTAFAGDGRKEARRLVDGVLPFNIRHRRHPGCYELAKSARSSDLRTERNFLTNEFTKRIRPIIESFGQPDDPPYEPYPPLSGRVSTFISDDELILPDEWPTIWKDEETQAYARFIPTRNLDLTPLDLERLCAGPLSGIPPFSTRSGNFGVNQYGFASCGTRALPDDVVISRDIIQFFRSGEVWAVQGSFLREDVDSVAWVVEDIFSWFALQVINFMRAARYTGPSRMVFGITGINGRRFANPLCRESSFPQFYRDVFLFERQIESTNQERVARVAERAAARLWEEVGLERPPEYSTAQGRHSVSHRAGYWHLLFASE